MAVIHLPEIGVSLEADEIVELEITAPSADVALVKIFLEGQDSPLEVTFPDKQKAVDFYNEIWRQRGPGHGEPEDT